MMPAAHGRALSGSRLRRGQKVHGMRAVRRHLQGLRPGAGGAQGLWL